MKQSSISNRPGKISRRAFIKIGGIAGAGAVLAACSATPTSPPAPTAAPTAAPTNTPIPTAAATQTPEPTVQPEPVLRIAHISDIHITTEQRTGELFNRALHNIQTHLPAFDFVINTGDCVMDSMFATFADAQAQWDAFEKQTSKLSLPFFHTIGNHDVWGWGKPDAAKQSDPLYGKGLAVKRLGIPNRYYAFEKGGWKFIVLDSTHLADQSFFQPYTGKLDEEQYAWLGQTLNDTPPTTPVCVISHIPILAANGLLDGDNETTGDWVLPGAWTHIDARRLWKLFWQNRQVKICLSGHSHQIEDLKYHGVNYLNNGAICGNWWNGSYMDSPPGYMSLALYADGSVKTEFIMY